MSSSKRILEEALKEIASETKGMRLNYDEQHVPKEHIPRVQ